MKKLKNLRTLLNINNFLLFIGVFAVGYILFMMIPAKKIDRYMLPIFPFTAIFSVMGYEQLLMQSRKYLYLILGFAVFFILCPLLSFFPYYFTYTSPIFGTPASANRVLAQKPFGMGIFDLKDLITRKYGFYPTLGFYDIKPMRSIYLASRIFDVRVYGTREYDILVLGPGEEFPEKVEKSNATYRYDTSMYINNLEYWKIYVKEN